MYDRFEKFFEFTEIIEFEDDPALWPHVGS
jgi:hypothetical protein